MTRREILALMPAGAFGQMASRGVKPMPRGKPSGLPFHAHFTDVAAQAGLRDPVIYGGPDRNLYIIEPMGSGIAFFDYDNDGWLDIFVLSGIAPGRTARGRYQPAIQEQSRRHFYRCHREGRTHTHGVGVRSHYRRL